MLLAVATYCGFYGLLYESIHGVLMTLSHVAWNAVVLYLSNSSRGTAGL